MLDIRLIRILQNCLMSIFSKEDESMIIRNEEERDFRAVEELTKKAFWNIHVPGCNEHYLAHILRKHSDFVPELDFVVEEDEKNNRKHHVHEM